MTSPHTSASRFIDLAAHGGCSRKVDAIHLEALLESLQLEQGWADAATIAIDGLTLATTVDIVLPMVDDPVLFGEIVVAHVLSDLYATGASPLFGINLLGVPLGSRAHDQPIGDMLKSEKEALDRIGVKLLGGHSIENEQLFLGLAAVGAVPGDARTQAGAKPGDALVLTKPLGTSIATWNWRKNGAPLSEHPDVVTGMRQFNDLASVQLMAANVDACTDVSGFGLAGHLHHLLASSGVGARVSLEALPRYPSTVETAVNSQGSRLLELNEDYMLGRVKWPRGDPDLSTKLYVYDAQVSGGLLAAVPASDVTVLVSNAAALDIEMAIIGVIDEDANGQIVFE